MNDTRLSRSILSLGEAPGILDSSPTTYTQSATVTEVIDLVEGDFDFASPARIIAHGQEALANGHTHYVEPAGLPALRQALIKHIDWIREAAYTSAENVVITPGGKFAIYALLGCLINPGESVIIFDPSWPSFSAMVRLLGGTPLHFPTASDTRYSPNLTKLQQFVRSDTRVMIINSPNNPTGRVYNRAELEALLGFAAEHDLCVISDEVYRDLVFEASYTPAAHLTQHRSRIVTASSFSKGVAMTGWRLGYIVGDTALMRNVAQFQLHTVTCANSIAQHAAAAALAAGDYACAVADVRQEYLRRRQVVLATLEQLPGIEVAPMEGTPFAWINVTRLTADAAEFATRLRNRYGVAVVPGNAFPGGNGYVRLCYAKAPPDQLEEALARFRACVETWS